MTVLCSPIELRQLLLTEGFEPTFVFNDNDLQSTRRFYAAMLSDKDCSAFLSPDDNAELRPDTSHFSVYRFGVKGVLRFKMDQHYPQEGVLAVNSAPD